MFQHIDKNSWTHLWFAGVLEWQPWCSIVGATVTVHQFFCILHDFDNLVLVQLSGILFIYVHDDTKVLLPWKWVRFPNRDCNCWKEDAPPWPVMSVIGWLRWRTKHNCKGPCDHELHPYQVSHISTEVVSRDMCIVIVDDWQFAVKSEYALRIVGIFKILFYIAGWTYEKGWRRSFTNLLQVHGHDAKGQWRQLLRRGKGNKFEMSYRLFLNTRTLYLRYCIKHLMQY